MRYSPKYMAAARRRKARTTYTQLQLRDLIVCAGLGLIHIAPSSERLLRVVGETVVKLDPKRVRVTSV